MTNPEAIRAGLLPFSLGLLMLSLAMGAIAFGLLRSGSRAALLSFGGFCGLYGLRLLLGTPLAQLLVDAPPPFWAHALADITYLINAPAALFFAHLLGGRWLRVFTAVAWTVALFACAAITIEAFAGPSRFMGPNAFLVLGSQALGAWAMVRPGVALTRELQVVRGAYAVLLFFVLNENVRSFGLPSVRGVEWIGFTIFLAGLGYATAVRVADGERKLVAHAQEMETARRIQASILPRFLPRLPGVSMAVRYRPMTAVAGDFYDVLASESGLGVLIADVSGHGVPAALVASMVKVAFLAEARHADDPARILSGVNRTLCAALDGAFVTAAYAWLDLDQSRLAYAAAGHPPLLLRGRNGVERLADNGLLMGLSAEAEYPVAHRSLARGDRLLLYTDGAIEAVNRAGDEFDVDRLVALLEASASTPEAFADSVVARLAEWGGGGADDDLTILVVDVDP